MHPAGFEPTIPVTELPHTHALDCAATGIGTMDLTLRSMNPVHTFPSGFFRPILMFSSRLRLLFEAFVFLQASESKFCMHFSSLQCLYHLVFLHMMTEYAGVKGMKPLIMHIFPVKICYLFFTSIIQ